MQWENQDTVGPWIVKTELVTESDEIGTLVKQKAVQNVENVMTGQIHFSTRISNIL